MTTLTPGNFKLKKSKKKYSGKISYKGPGKRSKKKQYKMNPDTSNMMHNGMISV